MELELVRVNSILGDSGYFYGFFILVPKGTTIETIIAHYRTLLNDDWVFQDVIKEMHEVGRITFHQEDAFVLGLKPGDIF